VESRTERNTIRPEICNPNTETDIVVQYSEVMFHGQSTVLHTHHEYSIEPTKCPECPTGSLLFDLNAYSKCPNCGRNSLFRKDDCGQVQSRPKAVVFGPPNIDPEAIRMQLQIVMSIGSEKTYRFLRELDPRMSHQRIYEIMSRGLGVTPEDFLHLATQVDAEDAD